MRFLEKRRTAALGRKATVRSRRYNARLTADTHHGFRSAGCSDQPMQSLTEPRMQGGARQAAVHSNPVDVKPADRGVVPNVRLSTITADRPEPSGQRAGAQKPSSRRNGPVCRDGHRNRPRHPCHFSLMQKCFLTGFSIFHVPLKPGSTVKASPGCKVTGAPPSGVMVIWPSIRWTNS